MDNILRASKAKNGVIVHELGDGETRREYITIRGAISWPIFGENVPGYFLILGEEYVRHFEGQEQRGKLYLLSELAAPDIRMSLDTFFSRIVNDAARLMCNTFYAIKESKGEDCDGYPAAFQKFAYGKIISCSIEQPPWADTPDIGMHYIKSWAERGLLSLPKGSLVHDQLRAWEPENIKQTILTFAAVNALRFVICGLEANVPTITSSDWRKKVPRGTWQSA